MNICKVSAAGYGYIAFDTCSMKKQFALTIVPICFLAVVVACSNSSEEGANISDTERQQIQSDVINRFNAMMKYAEAGELENVLMHFDPSGDGTYIDNGAQYSSLDDMFVNYRATWKIQKQDYGVPLTKVYVLSRESALITSSTTLSTTHRDGVVFQPRPWSVSTLWTLRDGEWFIHSFHQYAGDLKPVEQEALTK